MQLPAYVAGEDIFSDYAYFSSYSDSWVAHARRYADTMIDQLGLGPDSLVTEVASNDGYLLQHFVARGIPVLGVEPAANIAEVAVAKGIRTEVHFLGPETGAALAAEFGRADLVAGNNVYAHVPDLVGFTAGLAELLAAERAGHAGVPAPAAADRAPPVRHDLPRALPLPHAAHRVAGARHRRPARGRRRGADHARRLAAGARPPRGFRRRAVRARQPPCSPPNRRPGCTPSRGTPGSPRTSSRSGTTC